MATHLTRHDLTEAFDLLDWVDGGGTARELAALGPRLDEWLAPTAEIPLPGGGTFPEPGLDLGESAAGTVWLLSRGRLLVVGPAPAPEPIAIADVDARAMHLTDRLRSTMLAAYLGEMDLAELSPTLVFRTVSDLLDLVRQLDPAGREVVVRALAAAMRPGEGWDAAAARLRTGFEGLLGDRSPAVVMEATRALVRMAVGLGPRPPTGDPARGLLLLLGAPRSEVRAAALQALLQVPEVSLRGVASTIEPRLHDLLADEDPDVRRLASSVERRLAAGGPAGEMAARLESSDRAVRMAALSAWAAGPLDDVELLLPLVLDAVDDPDPALVEAGLAALGAVAARAGTDVHRWIVHGLLSAHTPSAVRAACEIALRDPGVLDPPLVGLLRDALARAGDLSRVIAEALSAAARVGSADDALAIYDDLLWHVDPAVREMALDVLARDARDRITVRDGLLPSVVEHLRDASPAVRLATARTVSAWDLPNAAGLVLQLALDPDASVRREAVALLRETASPMLAAAERRAELADRLYSLTEGASPDDRVHWAGALDDLVAEEPARAADVLVGLLRTVPAGSGDPFVRFALDEIDARLVAQLGCGTAIVETCRHLMAPPEPRPEHAARLAAACAAEEPLAFDLLWTMYTVADGPVEAAARDALAGLAEVPKSRPVAAIIRDLMERTDSPAERSVLRMLLRG